MSVLADIGIGPISIPTPGDVVTALKNAVVDVADAVFDKIIEWIAGLLADAVSKVTEALVTLLKVIRPSLTPGGAIENAATIQKSVLGLAASLVTLFFVFRIIHGLITGQAGQSLRATLVDLPMVIVGTLFFGFLCYLLLALVDQFSDPLITEYATTLNTTVGELYSKDGIVQGGIFVIIFSLLYIVAAVFLCFELFVRSSLIYLVVMFAPLAIATRIWGPTRSYARRATETAVALIFSKLAVAVTLATGASSMQGAADSGGNVAMIQGSAILLLAAFMPFALMRVIPMMEGAVAGEGVARNMGMKAAGGGVLAGGAAGMASKPVTSMAKRVRGSSGSGGGGGSSEGAPEAGGGVGPAAGGRSAPSPSSKPPSGGGSSGGTSSPPNGESSSRTGASGTTQGSNPSVEPSANPRSTSTNPSTRPSTPSPSTTDRSEPEFAQSVAQSASTSQSTTGTSSTSSNSSTSPSTGAKSIPVSPTLASTGRPAEVQPSSPTPTKTSSSPSPTTGPTQPERAQRQPNASKPTENVSPTPTAATTSKPASVPIAKSRTIARPALKPSGNEDLA